MTAPPLGRALAAVTAGGVLGALARYGLVVWFPVGTGFPWTVFAINVVGCALLAGMAGIADVARRPVLAVFLGSGICGGFTTMSAASEQTVALFERSAPVAAVLYAGGTVASALLAVVLVRRWVSRADA